MERSIYGGNRCKIFFCDPNRSDSKGSCENNHRMIRYVIPKGYIAGAIPTGRYFPYDEPYKLLFQEIPVRKLPLPACKNNTSGRFFHSAGTGRSAFGQYNSEAGAFETLISSD